MVGYGPGGIDDRTRRAERAISEADVVAGYGPYLDAVADLTAGKELVRTGMMREVERVEAALALAVAGKRVALVSSGDPGVYGMAGLAYELARAKGLDVSIDIVPGVTAANAAAARFGAPLMLDYAVISLSDLLVPWEQIRHRLQAVAAADLALALYNPRSTKRTTQIEEARDILLAHRPASTPVGIATAVSHADERLELATLEDFTRRDFAMRSVILIGNSATQAWGAWMVTPRGYLGDE